MKTLELLGVACVFGIAVTACSSSSAPTGVTPGAANQTHGGMRDAGPNGFVYVACTQVGEIAIESGYGYFGKITDGINEPEGLATDKNGNLYVANQRGKTITVYPPGATSPSLTLTESDKPGDVVVGGNGYVYAGDLDGGVDVYPPGGTSPVRRLTNSALSRIVSGVGVDASNNVYATGLSTGSFGRARPAVVKFANGSGSGTNLGLSGLKYPDGVIVDKNNNLVVTNRRGRQGEILIYPPGQTSPSGTIGTYVGPPVHSALNKAENRIYVPETDEYVYIFDYPSGKFTGHTYTAGGTTLGVASTL